MTDVFVDIETTGLDVDRHQIVELAWAVEDGPITVVSPRHDLRNADPAALQVNDYRNRLETRARSSAEQVSRFLLDVRGNTIVAANPAFDAGFLRAHFGGYAPWHYRLRDIQVYADAILGGWRRPPSLIQVRAALLELGHDIPPPDHTAGGDVQTLRAAWRALQRERKHARDLVSAARQPP